MCKKQVTNSRMWSSLLLMALFLVNSTWAFAQTAVRGTVKDATGEPLIGVNVLEKGTTNGTVTDFDGKFSLNVAKGKVLVFSYIGYQTQEIAVENNVIDVTLKDDSKLMEEVVVVGYGTMTRKDVTSSITTVKAEDMNVGVITDPAQLLQGKVAGLVVTSTGDPNGTPTITLRGASSLREGAAMEPYYVIDGIPGVDISMVAPDDIESIDVLRDATATAIYGSKAANGVIIITTKKGRAGRTNVSYNAYVAFDNATNQLDMMSADDLRAYARTNNMAIANDEGASTNWQDEVLRTGVSHNHNLAINGGNDKTSYAASLNYVDRNGVVKHSDMNRINARSFIQTKVLKDRLTLSASVNAMQGKFHGVMTEEQGASVLDAMNYYSPLVPVKNADGSWYESAGITQNYNPASMLEEDTGDTMWKRMQVIGKASLNIVDGLVWNANYSYMNRQSTYSSYHTQNTQINNYKQNGQANRNTYFGHQSTFETYVNYDKTFNEVHKLGLMAGYSWEEQNKGDGFGVTVYDFYNDDLGYYNLTYASKINGVEGVESGAEETIRNISFYGRANYSYAGKYMLQATLRRDGSSVFGINNRWATFPSVSAAWNIAEESFMKDTAFDQLKLRAGYGVSGNALGFGAYSAISTYGASGWFDYTAPDGTVSQKRTLAATGNSNPNLKWESTGMLNLGIDFGFLGGRLNGSIEFYDKKTSDLIYYYPVSTNRYPYDTMPANVGDITNRGVEFTLNAVPVKTKDFTWNTTVNLAHNKNTVDKLSNEQYSVAYIDQCNPNIGGFATTNVQRIMEGEALGTFYTWEWAGYDNNGSSLFYVHDAATGERTGETTLNPEDKDRTKTGCAQPKISYGWNNNISYKNWALTAFFQGVAGNKIFNSTRAQYNYIAMVSTGKNVLREVATWQNANDGNAHTPSDRYLEDGSYLRLATLTLGYTFKNLNEWANNITLYATCNNVFTLTGYKGIDPEVSLGGITPGVDRREYFYPHTRTFLFGVKVNF